MKRNQVYILSDSIGVGKTTAIQEWVKKTDNIFGFLSPDINGKRMFQNIESGKLIPMETEQKDLIVGKYDFDSESFKRVEKKIQEAWEAKTSDYIVLDEIGPLEIKKSLGFHELLINLQEENVQDKPNLLFVVRDYCLEVFLEKYDFKNVHVMTLEQFKSDFDH